MHSQHISTQKRAPRRASACARIYGLCAAVGIIVAPSANAELVTFTATGIVSTINANSNLPSAFNIGDQYSLNYTFDTATSSSSPDYGIYYGSIKSANVIIGSNTPYKLSSGGFNNISVYNNVQSAVLGNTDWYSVTYGKASEAYTNFLLIGNSASLPSISLPTSLNVSNFTVDNYFSFNLNGISLGGAISNISTAPTPPPPTPTHTPTNYGLFIGAKDYNYLLGVPTKEWPFDQSALSIAAAFDINPAIQ